MTGIRLHKFLSRAGVASRREAERLIARGSVKVNGKTITGPGMKIDPENDHVEMDGKTISVLKEMIYLLLHKPAGYTCTHRTFPGENNIFSLLPDYPGIHFAGRLDKDSSGLLLLTNDGDLTLRLTHPRYQQEKEYEVTTSRSVSRREIKVLLDGVNIGEGGANEIVRAVDIRSIRPNRISMVITQGRKRQVRRMLASLGHETTTLKRVRIKTLRLGRLQSGKWRTLSSDEIERLLE
jgi:23S rRNA pseudouridine2605 synthase